jgi:hypothetical protein
VHVRRLARQFPRDQPRGDDDHVAVQRRTVGQLQLMAMAAGAQGNRRVAEVGAHTEVVERIGSGKPGPVWIPLPREHLLGQWGPVIWRMRFGTDEADPALHPGRAQLLRRAQSAESGPDDHDVLRLTGHKVPSS